MKASVSRRGEHMIVAGPRVVGVGVGDHGAGGGAMRIDMEAARPAEQPAPVDGEPGFEPISFHGAAAFIP